MKATKLRSALSFLKEIALGVLIWLFLTTAVGEARVVPTGSMEPTIQVGDRLWTDKLLLRFKPVQRGDIVVFDPPFPAEAPYVKRVIGLPGETVTVENGKVSVDGQVLNEGYIYEAPQYQYGPVKVPEGQYLVLGDNRNHSNDSHYWGFVAQDRIKARAVFRIWPIKRIGQIQ